MDDCLNQYRPLTLADQDLINQYLSLVDYRLSNYNFLNLWMYTKWLPVYYYQQDDILFLSSYYGGHYFSFMPLCKKDKLLTAFSLIESHYQACGLPFIYAAFQQEYADLVLSRHDDFEKRAYRENFDYIYDISRFRNFGGKKLQKKRNHLNAFYQNYPNFVYQEIAPNNIDKVRTFVENWYSKKEAIYLDYDQEANNLVLDNYSQLAIKGACILIEDEVQGFIISSWQGKDTMQVNIEKANNDYRGIYQVLLKEFLAREFKTAQYMNREDDLGLENLRKAKLSYRPDLLLENYRVCLKDHHVD